MKVEYLLSFKDDVEVQDLDEDFINSISNFFIKSYSKKVKKKIIKPISKSNLLKNTKLQTSKDKIENKVNLIVNKLSKNNFDNIVKEFISTFQTIEQEDFNKVLKILFLKMIKDEKFIKIFFDFYLIIFQIYNSINGLDNQYFVQLIQDKVEYDYLNKELNDENIFISKLDKEEHRSNNLKLIILMFENKNFDKKLLNIISNHIVKTNNIPDIYFWFSNKFVKKNDPIQNYNNELKNKLTEDINNRFIVLLKNLLDCNSIKYEDIETGVDEYVETEADDEDCEINLAVDSEKSNFEIELENIIEEYFLLEDFDEIVNFIDKYKKIEDHIKLFTYGLLNLYFNSKQSSFDKYKKLIVNLKKNKLVKSDIFKDTLVELIQKEGTEDYLNYESKVNKIIDIFKIIQIKLTKKYIDSVKNFTPNESI